MTRPNKKKQLKKGIVVYTVTLCLCAIVAIFRYVTGKDVMSPTVFKSKILGAMTGEPGVYSIWPISHFVLYVFLGYLAPKWWWLWILVGVSWEIFEYICGLLVRKLQSSDITATLGKKAEKMFMPQYGSEWVSGARSDIIFNIMGLVIGLLLTKICKKDKLDPVEDKLKSRITYY